MTMTAARAYPPGPMHELNPGGSGFRVPPQAQEMIDALRKLFDASVVLYDLQRRKHHVARDSRGWYSLEVDQHGGQSRRSQQSALDQCHGQVHMQ